MNKRRDVVLSIAVVLVIATYFVLNFENFEPSITGQQIMSTRLVIVTRNGSACNMTMEPGWNLVSFTCIANDLGTQYFLQGLSPTYESIRYYDAFDTHDPWKSYNPHLPSWVIQDLSLISRKGGYLVKIYNQTLWYINGSLFIPTVIDFQPGWNLIGYPSFEIREVNETFRTLEPNYDYVYLYNASDSDWKEYTWNTSLFSVQDLTHTVPDYGYWIFMLNSDSLAID